MLQGKLFLVKRSTGRNSKMEFQWEKCTVFFLSGLSVSLLSLSVAWIQQVSVGLSVHSLLSCLSLCWPYFFLMLWSFFFFSCVGRISEGWRRTRPVPGRQQTHTPQCLFVAEFSRVRGIFPSNNIRMQRLRPHVASEDPRISPPQNLPGTVSPDPLLLRSFVLIFYLEPP